ncbi:MAG TPA: hypothetical protein PKO06_16060, partial [Candidatus Ozemobacteraceae bacterium]|nr:hypothetical protein [Candidatus Ozemobacteraceae bacterium]
KLRDGTSGSEKVYESRATEHHDLPSLQGEISYTVSALDDAGNESPTRRTASLSYDLTPPSVKGIFSPSFGRRLIPIYGLMSVTWKDIGEVVRPGPLDVALSFDEPLREAPKLSWRTSIADVPQSITLSRKTDTYYTGRLELPRCPGQDVDIRFALEASDAAGNKSQPLGEEARLLLDSDPPAAINQLLVEPGPLGSVRCSWAPPGKEPEGEPMYRLYRSNSSFNSASQAELIIDKQRETKLTDRPPQDGTWYYSVAAVDRAGYVGSLTPAISVMADSQPPAAPASLGVLLGREVVLSWTQANGSDTADWEVYLASEAIASLSDLQKHKPAAEHLTEPRYAFVPPSWPTIHLAVVARDQAGNRALSSLAPPLNISDKLPAAHLRIEPPSPARGAVRVLIESTLPLKSVPSLWFEPQGRSPIPLGVASDPASARSFTAALAVDERTGDGTGTFRFLGYSLDDLTGTNILTGKHLLIDTRAPRLRIDFVSGVPMRAGPVAVRVLADEPLAAPPEVTLIPQGGSPQTIALALATDGAYIGETSLAATLPDGLASVKASGRDLAGNVTSSIDPDRVFVDNHAPQAPTTLVAVARRHGTVELRWQAPASAFGEEHLREYVLYRHDSSFTHAASATVAARVRHPSCIDSTIPRDGLWYYAVAAIDEAGWSSPLSQIVSVVSDRTPPPAPLPPTISMVGDVIQLQWQSVARNASEAITYEVTCESPDPLGGRNLVARIFGPATATTTTHRPVFGGDLLYRVRGVDPLGHESDWS